MDNILYTIHLFGVFWIWYYHSIVYICRNGKILSILYKISKKWY